MFLWYIAGYALAGTIGWLASIVYASGHSPVGLTSLVVGAILGATLCGIAAGLKITRTRRLITGTIVIAVLTVLAEHTWLYLDYCRQWQQAVAAKPQAALFRATPHSAAEYFSHELTPESAALWLLDAVLITSNAAGVMFVLHHNSLAPNANPQPAIRNPQSFPSDT
jgi:hypothetical protein